MIGGVKSRFAHTAMSIDIFQNHNGTVNQHTDGKRNAGQADDI